MTQQLYLITPPKFDLDEFAKTLANTLDAGDVSCVQLRLKEASDDEIRKACAVLRPIVQDRDIAFVLNDNPTLAKELACDGVHVGQEDTPYKKAREIMGKDAIVGMTCHDSKHMAMVAGEQGADYVAFGAFYPTQTKEPKSKAEPWILEWWTSMFEVPCVAIGGITDENATPLLEAGADFIAVCGGVWDHPDGPEEAVKKFTALLNS
ncbi:Thiamine-phosphate synthase [Candidatus Terasakiella magnetica]|uniref:Thiamine-phosphate synthase n=1 Tax=Candidatus Terasakiella magnetica TaxID=1867952 RepID=A0A1C3RHP3_9PROT|nr:thiamine phosphate synthase [Candidatus Terasakiella magnetica]SCA56787.1 Thiamine-phosphate synthase [Candidatus Terasakiella magnetica]